MPNAQALKDAAWVRYWTKYLRAGADPALILSQMRQYAATGRVLTTGDPWKEVQPT